MDSLQLGQSSLRGSRLAYGCMRIFGDGSSSDRQAGKRAIGAALDAGYTVFDHADIYSSGECEKLFGEYLNESPSVREGIVIIDKCGIRLPESGSPDKPARYDFSKDHIVKSVEGCLRRLDVEQIDLLLLHRPDYLMNAAELAGTLEALHASGKVANFGVSNFSPSQVDLLASAFGLPLLVNQVEINVHNVERLSDGTLDQCQRLGITPQAWCPVAGIAYPAWGNTFSTEDDTRVRAEVSRQAESYRCSETNIALAWLLRHPASISPIVGSTSPERILDATKSMGIRYSREDWYRLLEARNGQPVP
ncbi:MAG: aldo/keto reductase [Woeseiaceae bacterium]|nr:aldo/keto reductase [Woeseiaceae bacterium]